MVKTLIQSRFKGEIFAKHAVKELARKLSGNKLCVVSEHRIEWRVKSEKAVRAKAKISLEERVRSSLINDFIGIRVLASHMGCLGELEKEIAEWANQIGLVQVEREDKFEHPDESCYRAIHFDYRFLRSQDWELPSMASVELQLTTKFQHLHGDISHRLYHKANSPFTEEVRLFLNNLSNKLHEIDEGVMNFSCHKNSGQCVKV